MDWSGDFVTVGVVEVGVTGLTITGQPVVDAIPPPVWLVVPEIPQFSEYGFNGNHLIHVLQPNTTLTFTTYQSGSMTFPVGCRLVITQLQ